MVKIYLGVAEGGRGHRQFLHTLADIDLFVIWPQITHHNLGLVYF